MGKLTHKVTWGLTRVRSGPSAVARALRKEWRAWKTIEADRSHLATTGDRPFVGCSPCEAAPMTEMASARTNPMAQARSAGARE